MPSLVAKMVGGTQKRWEKTSENLKRGEGGYPLGEGGYPLGEGGYPLVNIPIFNRKYIDSIRGPPFSSHRYVRCSRSVCLGM